MCRSVSCVCTVLFFNGVCCVIMHSYTCLQTPPTSSVFLVLMEEREHPNTWCLVPLMTAAQVSAGSALFALLLLNSSGEFGVLSGRVAHPKL